MSFLSCFLSIWLQLFISIHTGSSKHKTAVSLAQEYIQLAKKYYNAEPQSVDFAGAADEIRRDINSRVKHQTEGKLQLLPSQFKKKPFWH